MYFMALATDYDGTIAHDGIVAAETLGALTRLKQAGRKLILVTGRELPDLERAFPELPIFDRVVVENGALLYMPATKEARALGDEPPAAFVQALRDGKVEPLSVGRVIVATWEPNETFVLEAIRNLDLDLQITFNKGAVMVLPSGINKASGLEAALEDLGLSAHNVVAVGDAENDLAFMRSSGCAVAVANALPAVKDAADLTTPGARGQGVVDLVDRMIEDEPSLLVASAERHGLELGVDDAGEPVHVLPRADVLIAGTSGSGKSTVANALLERMVEGAFQFCILDPEGDYADFEGAVVFGDVKAPARPDAVLAALEEPKTNVVVNMLGIDHAERPGLFAKVHAALCSLREATARPHWLVADEAHHMLPDERDGNSAMLLGDHHPSTIFITVHPDHLARRVLEGLGVVIGVGRSAADVIRTVAQGLGRECPVLPERDLDRGEVLLWTGDPVVPARRVKIRPPAQHRKRHTRKYAEGALGEDKSFYFQGPRRQLNLRAQNLTVFLQMADGVDAETFVHHLKAGDYSDWFANAIKDDELADETRAIEAGDFSVEDARERLRQAVEARYTAPA